MGSVKASETSEQGVFKSHHEDVEIPHLDLLTFFFDSDWCAAKDDTTIYAEAANPDNSITKSEARKVVRRISHVLRNRYGIGASGAGKDVVLSTSLGSPFIPVLFYSIVAAGGVYSGASSAFTVQEMVRQVKDADAKLLLCSPEFEQNTVEAAKQCGIPLDRILIIDSNEPRNWKLISLVNRSNLLEADGAELDWRKISNPKELQETTACLLYSSGTTGLPKGVRISQWNLIATCVCYLPIAKAYLDQKQKEGKPFKFSMISHLPTAHIGGMTWSSLLPFYLGGTAYWIKKYDFGSFIDYHRKYRLTILWTVPPIWLDIAKSPKVTDHFDSVEVVATGAAPMGSELTKEAVLKVGKGQKIKSISNLYGNTETSGSITGTDWGVNDLTHSHGAPFANTKFRFVDEDLKDVEPGEPGEVLVGGPLVSQGYHNRPEATRDSFFDGYYRTGDVGVWKNGLVYIVDRRKEMIKYKGLQVAPAELEALLISHPKINDVAVMGVIDEKQATEVPKAFIVLKPDVKMEAQEAIDFVQKNVAQYKRLRGGVAFVDEIPKSPSGKILRQILRKRHPDELKLKAKL